MILVHVKVCGRRWYRHVTLDLMSVKDLRRRKLLCLCSGGMACLYRVYTVVPTYIGRPFVSGHLPCADTVINSPIHLNFKLLQISSVVYFLYHPECVNFRWSFQPTSLAVVNLRAIIHSNARINTCVMNHVIAANQLFHWLRFFTK